MNTVPTPSPAVTIDGLILRQPHRRDVHVYRTEYVLDADPAWMGFPGDVIVIHHKIDREAARMASVLAVKHILGTRCDSPWEDEDRCVSRVLGYDERGQLAFDTAPTTWTDPDPWCSDCAEQLLLEGHNEWRCSGGHVAYTTPQEPLPLFSDEWSGLRAYDGQPIALGAGAAA